MSLRDSLYLDGNLLSRRQLEKEAEAGRLTWLEAVYLPPGEVQARYGIRGRAAILGFGNVSADPRRLAAGVLRGAIARGARPHQPVEIASVTPGRHRVLATASEGAVITSRWVVFATGYELARGVPRRGHRIVSTWAMATVSQRLGLWPSQCYRGNMCCHTCTMIEPSWPALVAIQSGITVTSSRIELPGQDADARLAGRLNAWSCGSMRPRFFNRGNRNRNSQTMT